MGYIVVYPNDPKYKGTDYYRTPLGIATDPSEAFDFSKKEEAEALAQRYPTCDVGSTLPAVVRKLYKETRLVVVEHDMDDLQRYINDLAEKSRGQQKAKC